MSVNIKIQIDGIQGDLEEGNEGADMIKITLHTCTKNLNKKKSPVDKNIHYLLIPICTMKIYGKTNHFTPKFCFQ